MTMKRLSAPFKWPRRGDDAALGFPTCRRSASRRSGALCPPRRRYGRSAPSPARSPTRRSSTELPARPKIQPMHKLATMPWPRAGRTAVTAHHNVDRRPAGADAADDMLRTRALGAVLEGLAGAQDDGDGLAGDGLIDMDRLEAAAVLVGRSTAPMAAGRREPGPRCRRCRARCDEVPARSCRAEHLDHRRHHPA